MDPQKVANISDTDITADRLLLKKLKKSVKNNKKIKFVYAPQEIVFLNVFKANYYQLWIYLVNYLDFQTPRIQKLQTTTEGTKSRIFLFFNVPKTNLKILMMHNL